MINLKTNVTPIKVSRKKIEILDQRLLPHEVVWISCGDTEQVADAINNMSVRGAVSIGIVAAYGYYFGVQKIIQSNKRVTLKSLERIEKKLNKARPTAINLMWATKRMRDFAEKFVSTKSYQPMELLLALYNEACEIHEAEANLCLTMAHNSTQAISKIVSRNKMRILTHCNTGALATCGIGTALGVIRYFAAMDRVEMVYAGETRPFLQGSRLTAYELGKEKIPHKIIVDSMAAFLMQKGEIDFVIVGADRITKNGDVANKIGTYSLSVLAKAHKIPFFVVAPKSTFDFSLARGNEIPIEERPASEVTHLGDKLVASRSKVVNYSFDITPRENITELLTENGAYNFN